MKWFEGPIPEAIQLSKQRKVVFVVYVHGQDELSKKMNNVWDEESVSKICDKEGCVAIRIPANSDECGFFSQIYPVVVVPSTYFIGVDGVPLEVTAGFVESEAFTDKINSVVQLHKMKTGISSEQVSVMEKQNVSMVTETPQSDMDTGRKGDDSSSVMDVSASEAVASTSSFESVPKGDNSESSTDSTEVQEDQSNQDWLKERQDRVRQLMAEKRIEKQNKEAESDKQKEAERRQIGQGVQKLREFQKEREILETQKQLKKDKEEDKKAKARIREQIAKDREERAAKYKKEKQEKEELIEERKKAKLMEQQQAAAELEARRSETARIQVRLPDGSSITNTFPSTETLQSLYNFVSEHLGSDVKLSTTFPRRTFTEEDFSQTFMSLQLAPSAVIIAVPIGRSVISTTERNNVGILSLLLAPFLFIWNFIYAVFFGSGSSQPPDTDNTRNTNTSYRNQQQSSSSTENTTEFTRRTDRPKTAYQRRTMAGNTHRLADMRDDDDDDMGTWNGNSTQQL